MSEKKVHYAWWIMISCCAITFSIHGLCNAFGIFLPLVSKELGFSRGALSFYITLFQLFMIVSLPIAGKLLPKVNIRVILPISAFLFIGAFAAMSQFHDLTSFYIAGTIQGICGFLIYLPIPVLINNWFKSKMGFALGLSLAFSGVGGAILNTVGAAVIQDYGWRMGYLVLGAIAAAACLPFLLFVVRFKPSDMGLQPYGTEAVANQVNKTGIVTEAVGMSAGQAIKTISFYCMFICGGLLALGANFNYQVPGFVNSIGYSPLVGGSVASTVMIGAIIGKFVLGYLNDKIGVKGASIVGLADGMLAMVLMLLAKMHIYLLYTGAFLFGFGFAMLTVVPPLIVRLIFGQKDYSAIYSYLSTIQAVMGAIAVFGFGWLYDVTNTFASSLIIVGASYAVCLVLIFIALKAGKSILESENKVQLRT